MNTRRIGRSLPRVLAGTVLIGSLAFAAQVESQQQSGTQGRKPERGAGQRGPGGEGRRGGPGSDSLRVERRLGMLTERLSLTANQQSAVRTILTDEQAQMEALRPEGAGGPGGPGGPGGFGGRGPRGARTDSAGRGGRTRPDSAARAERQRPDSAEMAQRRAEFEAVRVKMDALRAQTDARIEQVLSSEQRTTYRELVANRPEGGPGRGGRGPGGRGGPGRGGFDRGGQVPPPRA